MLEVWNDMKAGASAAPGRAAAIVASGVLIMSQAFAGVAGAQSVDPTGGASTDLQTGLTDWVTDYGLPMLVALMVLGAVIAVLVRFGRKARNQI